MRRKTLPLLVAITLIASSAIAAAALASHEFVQKTYQLTGSLVPTYKQCLTAEATVTHASPISFTSCPVTSGTRDTSPLLKPKPYASDGSGFNSQLIIATKRPSSVFGSADVVDLKLSAEATGVLCETAAADPSGQNGWVSSSVAAARCPSGAGGPYSGNTFARLRVRLTDQNNCPSLSACSSGTGHATTPDFNIDFIVPCTSGTCGPTVTSWDALFSNPYIASQDPTVSNKRGDLQVLSLLLKDSGGDGNIDASGCPDACGDGDEHDAFGLGAFVK